MNKKLVILTTFLLFTLTSCDPRMVYDKFKDTGNNSWHWDEKIQFEANIQDTVNAFNVFVNIRHTKKYPFSNLYLFLALEGPNDGVIRDTLEFIIAEPSGKWKGTGFGNIKMVRKKFREAVQFARKGTYTFTLEQGMRKEEIPVTDVGIRIEKFQKLR